MGVVNSGPPSGYSLQLFLVWVLPCFLLAAFGGVKLYRELWGTNWTPDLRERGIAEVAEQRLRQGEALVGKGWRLTTSLFKAGSLEVPFSEVAGAGLFGGGRVALWKIGEEQPFFTVPARSTNVMVLHDVLAARLPSHALGLGRLQFEKRSALALRGFRCYERGLVKHSVLGRREILFAEVGGLTFGSLWYDVKGIHLFTHLSLSLHHRQGGEPFRVSLLTRRKGDRDVEGLRDRLSEGLAGEAYGRLDSEREIPWLNGVRLTRDGVLYPIPGRTEGAGDGYVSYAQGVLHSFEGGDFYLYRKGDGKPVLHLPAGAPNFFPGFALLERLASAANAAREARNRV